MLVVAARVGSHGRLIRAHSPTWSLLLLRACPLRGEAATIETRCSVTRRPLSTPAAAVKPVPPQSFTPSARGVPTQGAPIHDALQDILHYAQETKKRKFVESVDIAIVLGVDPRKPNQGVRGVQTLPHGTGQKVRVAVFARGQDVELAKAAGAALVGAEDLVKTIQDGAIDFERCIATPEVMPLVSRVARVLGPRGLMPNPKMGTVTKDVAAAVKVQFKADKFGMVHASVGKVDFTFDALLENIRAFMVAIGNAKPEAAKGTYIKSVHLSTTMGKGAKVDVSTVDPRSSRFMLASSNTTVKAT